MVGFVVLSVLSIFDNIYKEIAFFGPLISRQLFETELFAFLTSFSACENNFFAVDVTEMCLSDTRFPRQPRQDPSKTGSALPSASMGVCAC